MATATKKHKVGPWGRRVFIINNLGECYREYPDSGGKSTYVMGDINVSELRVRLGREPSEQDFTDEFHRLADERLDAHERALYRKVTELQQANNGRFRVYGWLTKAHEGARPKRHMTLVTEFKHWTSDRPFWAKLRALAKQQKMTLRTIDRSQHLDQTGHHDPKTGKIVWKTGPDHGRMTRQVEMAMELPANVTLHGVIDRMMHLAYYTHELWCQAGVGVC